MIAQPILSAGTFLVTHETPLKDRWGGWYVTGRHGGQRHMGNVVTRNEDNPEALDREPEPAGVTTRHDAWPDTANPVMSKAAAMPVTRFQSLLILFIAVVLLEMDISKLLAQKTRN